MSYTTNLVNDNIQLNRGVIRLPKVGEIKANTYRMPEVGYKLKAVTVKQTRAGKYYVSVLFEFYKDVPDIQPTEQRTLGLDYSSPHFYVDSEGSCADYQHYYRKAEARLARMQRVLANMEYGSKNYTKQLQKVRLLHEKVANQRKDFCHQLSRKITNSYDSVCVEDINLRGLASSLKLGKSTNDNGFGMFRNMLKYKLEEQGKKYIVLNKWYPSSKMCRHCGTINSGLKLSDRTWACACCKKEIDRDHNAAINIRNAGLMQYKETTKQTA